jgi:hypothetical protein
MEVDFNNLRLKTAEAYNRLVKELNRHVHGEEFGPGIDCGDTFCTGDIRDDLDDLRNGIAILLCLYDEKENIKCIDFDLKIFAPEE